jgi:hypothetical protein
MDQETFEKYVEIITEKIYKKLAGKEAGTTGVPVISTSVDTAEPPEPAAGKRIVTEQDVLAMAARRQRRFVCDQNVIITDLALERMKREGISLIKEAAV